MTDFQMNIFLQIQISLLNTSIARLKFINYLVSHLTVLLPELFFFLVGGL